MLLQRNGCRIVRVKHKIMRQMGDFYAFASKHDLLSCRKAKNQTKKYNNLCNSGDYSCPEENAAAGQTQSCKKASLCSVLLQKICG